MSHLGRELHLRPQVFRVLKFLIQNPWRFVDVVAAIKRVTQQYIRYIINTSADPDHVSGNDVVAISGQTLLPQVGFVGVGVAPEFARGGASILAAEQVLTCMSGVGRLNSPMPIGRQKPSKSRGNICTSMARVSKSSISQQPTWGTS